MRSPCPSTSGSARASPTSDRSRFEPRRARIAFGRRRGFAFLWLPGQYLQHPGAEVVLALALGRHDPSERFKEVSHPATDQWMHHLELHGPDQIDDEVIGWLREAMERAS